MPWKDVRLSVTHWYSIKITKHNIKRSHRQVAIPFWFSISNVMATLRRRPPNGGVNAGCTVRKNRDF